MGRLTRDYFSQNPEGVPVFNSADYPELAGKIDQEIWGEQPATAAGENIGAAAYALDSKG